MTLVAIAYHSGFGHTKKVAEFVEQGASSVEGIQTRLINVEEITDKPESLNDADAIIFGTPTYMGSVSAPFKAFMDASSKVWFAQGWKDKVAAGFTNSHSMSGDKLNTLIQLTVFSAQHGMIWVGQGESNGSPEGEPGKSDAINRIGSYLGAMAQSENASSDVTPPEGDLETAKRLGQRVAEITKRLTREN